LAQAILAQGSKRPSNLMASPSVQSSPRRMAIKPLVTLAFLMGGAVVARAEAECSAGDCNAEENSLLSVRSVQNATSRRRKPPVHCVNNDGTSFQCAGGDKCCGGACVGENDICCQNTQGDSFPCQGQGGGCCGNACFAPGSKCCKPWGPVSAWYPVSKETECRKASVQCTNRYGDEFECAHGDRCCGDTCVSKDDVCCENVLGNNFPCQGNGGGCCGNACYAPGSKCCKSPFVAKARWYPVTKDTKCAFGWPW